MKEEAYSAQIKSNRYFLGGRVRPLVAWAEGRNRVEYQRSLEEKVILS